MKVLVFCSAFDLSDKYTKPAKELGVLLAKSGHDLVWGGSNVGLMEVMASAFQDNGAKIFGVSVEKYHDTARKNADEMLVADNLGHRKSEMLKRADAIVVLVGGIGTLDEITEVLEFKKQDAHKKPIVILNTEGFYDGFKTQFEKMVNEGLIKPSLEHYLFFANTPEQAVEYINSELAK